MLQRLEEATVGEIVAADFRAAGVFEHFGIDFCCGGRRSIADACRSSAADPARVLQGLRDLPPPTTDDGVTEWSVERLVHHIVSHHHTYVRSALPLISGYLARLEKVHGVRHPELTRIASRFASLQRDLEQHMLKEEQILFPYVREIAALHDKRSALPASPFGTVGNPIRMMEREHREAADALREIAELTGGYVPPDDGCTTYTVCMAELARFEKDLHRHVHLENNVLFPRALEMESDFHHR